jgi:hypothetical protein
LAQNPISNGVFASASTNFIKRDIETEDKQLSSVQIWKLSEESISNFGAQLEGKLKKQKVETSKFEPT